MGIYIEVDEATQESTGTADTGSLVVSVSSMMECDGRYVDIKFADGHSEFDGADTALPLEAFLDAAAAVLAILGQDDLAVALTKVRDNPEEVIDPTSSLAAEVVRLRGEVQCEDCEPGRPGMQVIAGFLKICPACGGTGLKYGKAE